MTSRHILTEFWTDRPTSTSPHRLAAIGHAAAAGLRAIAAGLVAALHESRRRQSARELARHRHLIDALNARRHEQPAPPGERA